MSIQPTEADHNLPEVRGADAEAVRTSANESRTELMRRQIAFQQSVAGVKAELEERRKAADLEYQAAMNALQEQMKPMQAELARMKEVLHTVDLYLGRQEDMTLLRDGEAAPSDSPITVRQRVLAADEESLVLLDSGGVDARSMQAFLDWMADSIENTERLLPEPRCVVAVVPTRQTRDYGDPWMNAQLSEANAQTHWLFRNGEKLYVMTTDFTAGQVILPRRDEFAELFEVKDFGGRQSGKTMVPGSDQWMKAEEKAGARKRHYLKVGMILQGVIDRTTVFQPLPEGGVNLLSVASQDLGQVRMINELDMALTDGRESFKAWQARLNGMLAPGMRIIGSFARWGHGFHDEYQEGDRWTRSRHPRLSPPNAEYPPSNVPHLIETRNSSGGFVFRYARTEKIEKRNVEVPGRPGYIYKYPTLVEPKNRASCEVRSGDEWVLPYDLATIADLTYYLNHREARKDYQDMVPVIKAALAGKRAEREAEAPFRVLLAGMLAVEHGMDLAEVESLLPDVVDRWKLGNKWARALTGDDAHEGKALKGVMAEFAATLNSKADGQLPAKVKAAATSQFGDRLLAILCKRDGSFLAIAKAVAGDPFGDGWLDTMPVTKTGLAKPVTAWTTVAARTISRAVIVWEAKAWSTFIQADPSVRLSGAELAEGVQFVLNNNMSDRLFAVVYAQHRNWSEAPSHSIEAVYFAPDSNTSTQLEAVAHRWKRVAGKVVWTKSDRTYNITGFTSTVIVDGVARKGDMPWITNDDTYGHDLWRLRLAWMDPEKFLLWRDSLDAANAKSKAAQDVQEKERSTRNTWVSTVHEPAFNAYLNAQLKAAFLAEYGAGAEDLFAHHLTTLNLNQFHRAANDALNKGPWRDVAGKTIAELGGHKVPAEVAGYRFPAIETEPKDELVAEADLDIEWGTTTDPNFVAHHPDEDIL